MRRLDWFTRLAASMLRHADAALEAEDLEEADMEAARRLRRMRRLPQALRVYADALTLLADTADYIVSLRFAQSVKGFGEDLPDPSREEYIATSVYHATRALIVEHLDELLDLYAEKENKEDQREKRHCRWPGQIPRRDLGKDLKRYFHVASMLLTDRRYKAAAYQGTGTIWNKASLLLHGAARHQ